MRKDAFENRLTMKWARRKLQNFFGSKMTMFRVRLDSFTIMPSLYFNRNFNSGLKVV